MLVFLKLGGSLITEKTKPHTVRADVLKRLADEIALACQSHPDLRLVIGHGSGSFGHVPAKKYGTRDGIFSLDAWRGFVEVYQEARDLNEIVLACLEQAGLPVIAFPPSACVTARDGNIIAWDLAPIRSALAAGIFPLINGDVCFDGVRGGTIQSTEDLFTYLAPRLQPGRILLAGIEAGVWEDFPHNTRLIPVINPQNYDTYASSVGFSLATDVTGGMREKVSGMLDLVKLCPGLQVVIFSGIEAGSVSNSLLGAELGTIIRD